MSHPYHVLSAALGVVGWAQGSICALCGTSPFAAGGSLPSSWMDRDALTCPEHGTLCAGCARLIAGRPGDDPPPLRTRSLSWTPEEGLRLHARASGLWHYLDAPPERCVLSWATSSKRHHWLSAGLSSSARLVIGSDVGPIEYQPSLDRVVLDAVVALLASPSGEAPIFPRAAIRSGEYHPAAVGKFGLAAWRDAEAVVERYRPGALLDLLTYCAPVTVTITTTEDHDMHDPSDLLAARLVGQLARASAFRSRDGKTFWGGFLRHRLERVRRLPLADAVARLLDALEVVPTWDAAIDALAILAHLSDAERAAVEHSIRTRPALVHQLAYDHVRAHRKETTA